MSFMHRAFSHFWTGQVLVYSVSGRSGVGGRDEFGAMDCLGLSLRLVGDPVQSIGTVVSNLAVGHPSSSLTLSLWRNEAKRTGRRLPAKVTGKLRITDTSSSQPRQRLTAFLPAAASFPVPPCPVPQRSKCRSVPPVPHPVPGAAPGRSRRRRPSSPPRPAQARPSRPPSGGLCAGARGRSGAGAVPEVTRRPRRGPAAEGGRRAGHGRARPASAPSGADPGRARAG